MKKLLKTPITPFLQKQDFPEWSGQAAANAVDPAMVAARALEQAHLEEASHLEAEGSDSEASEVEVIESEAVENGEAEAV